jgi:hypothetical protein
VIHTLPALPSIIQPGRVVIGVAGLRDRLKTPELISGARVKCAGILWSIAECDFDVVRAKHNCVFENERNSVPLDAGVNESVSAKRGVRLACRRV